MNTLVDMISGMEVKEDDEDFMNAVDYMFAGLEKRKPDCFAVKQYKKYKLASGKTAKSILISCGARLPFIFAIGVAAAFMALIVRVIKNAFAQAVKMKDELDYTV